MSGTEEERRNSAARLTAALTEFRAVASRRIEYHEKVNAPEAIIPTAVVERDIVQVIESDKITQLKIWHRMFLPFRLGWWR